MTVIQTLQTLRKSGKPVSKVHLYRLFAVLDIKPLGRSRPQIYPADAADRIKVHLGLPVDNQLSLPALTAPRQKQLVTVAQLRAAKPSKRKGTK